MVSAQSFTFTVDSIINPGTKGAILGGAFKIQTITNQNKTVDECSYTFPDKYF